MEQEKTLETEIGAQLEARPIEVITTEIIAYKQVAGQAIVEIGNRLMEAKAQLSHGEWLPWLEEKVQFSEASAQRFMRLAKEYSNPSALTDLGSSKALSLLALPPVEREEFIEAKHKVNGEEKTVYEMTSRELDAAIQKLKAKDEEIKELNSDVDQLADEVAKQEFTIKELKGELDELRNKEPEVREVVDTEAQDKLQKKINKLTIAIDKAEAAKAEAESELAKAKEAQTENERIHSENIKLLEKKNEDLRKQLAVASSSEISIFKIHFEQAQQSINDMLGCIGRMRSSGDDESADKTANAYRSLLESGIAAL